MIIHNHKSTLHINKSRKLSAFVYEKFYPSGEHQYVTFSLGDAEGNVIYMYWQEVLNLMFPMLQKVGLAVLLLNTKSKISYQNCSQLKGDVTINELAFILKS